MKRIPLYLLTGLLLLVNNSCSSDESFSLKKLGAGAGVANVAAVSLTGLSVEDILGKFHSVASQLLFEGERRGNTVMQMLGNQLEVAIGNANIMLRDQQKTFFENLDKSEQTFFTQLNAMIAETNTSLDRAISILETANLNLLELINLLPLTSKNYNYISKIEGLCLTHQDGNYRIKVFGLGFGQDLDKVKYTPSIKIGDKTLALNHITRVAPFEAQLNIPHDLLEPYFKEDSISSLPFEINMVATVKSKCGLFFNCEKTISSSWNLKIALMPITAGILEGEEIISGQAWDGKIKTKSSVTNTADKPYVWQGDLDVEKDQRIVGVRYVCSAGMCPWSYSARKPGYDGDFDILQDATHVTFYRYTEGPATITHYVDYETKISVETKRPITPIKIQFSKPILLPLSADNTGCTYRLHGKLVTGQEFYIDNSVPTDANKLITRVSTGTGNKDGSCQPSFILSIP